MSYTLEQRLAIGKEIYDDELTRYEAAKKYDICEQSARRYMRLYRDTNQLPPKRAKHKRCLNTTIPDQTQSANLETYASKVMGSEHLTNFLQKSRKVSNEFDCSIWQNIAYYKYDKISLPRMGTLQGELLRSGSLNLQRILNRKPERALLSRQRT